MILLRSRFIEQEGAYVYSSLSLSLSGVVNLQCPPSGLAPVLRTDQVPRDVLLRGRHEAVHPGEGGPRHPRGAVLTCTIAGRRPCCGVRGAEYAHMPTYMTTGGCPLRVTDHVDVISHPDRVRYAGGGFAVPLSAFIKGDGGCQLVAPPPLRSYAGRDGGVGRRGGGGGRKAGGRGIYGETNFVFGVCFGVLLCAWRHFFCPSARLSVIVSCTSSRMF